MCCVCILQKKKQHNPNSNPASQELKCNTRMIKCHGGGGIGNILGNTLRTWEHVGGTQWEHVPKFPVCSPRCSQYHHHDHHHTLFQKLCLEVELSMTHYVEAMGKDFFKNSILGVPTSSNIRDIECLGNVFLWWVNQSGWLQPPKKKQKKKEKKEENQTLGNECTL